MTAQMNHQSEIRPLTTRERWVTVWVGFGSGASLANLLPFLNGSTAELNVQGLLPAALACDAVCVVLCSALFWLLGYALRRAAVSPRAPKWLRRGMAA